MAEPQPIMRTAESIPTAVRSQLQAFITEHEDELRVIGTPVGEALDQLTTYVLDGGKRIRPLFAWAGFVGAGGTQGPESSNAVLRAISALEFIQACALIHDDIIDASDTRRGRPTIHRALEKHHRERSWLGSSADYGEAIAILVGDLALVWAEDMFQEAGLSRAALERSRPAWRAMRAEVIGGQILDIALEASGAESIEMANSVNRYKTAAYTIERPLHLGAAIANAPAHLITAFRRYGRDIGIAFQLRDDLLGIFGDPAVTGKPAGDDLREGKRTVLLSLALQALDRSNPAAAAELRAGVGHDCEPADIARLTDIIAGTNAPTLVEKRIDELTEQGLGSLHGADLEPDITQLLTKLARKATERRA